MDRTAPATRFRVPHTLVLLLAMVVVAQILTYVLPQGRFERATNEHGREVVVAGSYEPLQEREVTPWHRAFTAVPSGFAAAEEIIFFVFLVGGAFAVLRATGAIDALIGWLLRRFRDRPTLLIAGGMFAFAMGSATIGMAEEYLPFVPVLLVLARGMGFDAISAVGILCLGYGIGYGAAFMNPFTVMVAQEVSGLQPGSGIGLRLVLLALFLPIGIHHVWAYTHRVMADPSRSLMAGAQPLVEIEEVHEQRFERMHIAVLVLVVAAIGVIVLGLMRWGWYLHEMGGLFLGLSIVLAWFGRMSADRWASTFCTGAAELTTTALLIGFARTIQVVLDEGQVVDTIIHAVSQPLVMLGPQAAAVGMLAFQSLCNFFIPSGSGQAYVTMPLMAPLADLVGVTRQTAVLAYQFGDGLMNIVVPTNAVLVGILGLAGVPYDRWLRFVLPFLAKILLAASVAVVVATLIGYD
jgi:uncharacterized ion transporter superfamily protein YfcC